MDLFGGLEGGVGDKVEFLLPLFDDHVFNSGFDVADGVDVVTVVVVDGVDEEIEVLALANHFLGSESAFGGFSGDEDRSSGDGKGPKEHEHSDSTHLLNR